MADVARPAGVSHQTVSRVINGHSSHRPATRARVEEAIRQLGYRPNTVARALVTRRSATVGMIATNGGLWGPSTVHRAIQAAGLRPLEPLLGDWTAASGYAVGRLAIDTLQVAIRPKGTNAGDRGVSTRRGRLIKPVLVRRDSTAPVPERRT